MYDLDIKEYIYKLIRIMPLNWKVTYYIDKSQDRPGGFKSDHIKQYIILALLKNKVEFVEFFSECKNK